MNDEAFLSLPDLPQYGKLQAQCRVSLPASGGNAIVAMVFGVIWFAAMIVLMGVFRRLQDQPFALEMTLGAVSIITLACLGLYFRCASRLNEHALFVYDGGVHLNETVSWMNSDGNFLSLHSGLRQVSLPWRVLSKFQAKERRQKGNLVTQAILRLPDGRRLQIRSVQGDSAEAAISKLAEKLG